MSRKHPLVHEDPGSRTAVYRLYDGECRLLYSGVTSNFSG